MDKWIERFKELPIAWRLYYVGTACVVISILIDLGFVAALITMGILALVGAAFAAAGS